MILTSYAEMQGKNGALAQRKEFMGESSLCGWRTKDGLYVSRDHLLNEEESKKFNAFNNEICGNSREAYIVTSMNDTPIAWGYAFVPLYVTNQKFDFVMSMHKNYVRAWVNLVYDVDVTWKQCIWCEEEAIFPVWTPQHGWIDVCQSHYNETSRQVIGHLMDKLGDAL